MQRLIKNVNVLFIQSCMMILALWFFVLMTFFHLLNKFLHYYYLCNYLFLSVRPGICFLLQFAKLGSSRLLGSSCISSWKYKERGRNVCF